MPKSLIVWLPIWIILAFTSLTVLSYTSSIRPGCILPSLIKVSIVILAISLRSGSNDDKLIASGVSSIIKSTPVTDSIVLIFLPSRPINLPFMSSLGKSIVLTVWLPTTSSAYLSILLTINCLAISWASNLAFASSSLI